MAFQIQNRISLINKSVVVIPEIIPVYTPGTLILWYKMDNTTTNDGTAGTTYNGTLTGTASFTNAVTAKRGTRSLLTNPTSNMSIPKIYLTDGTNSNGFTISMWIIKPTNGATGNIVVLGEGTNMFTINIFGGSDGVNYNIYFNLTTSVTKQGLVVAQGIGASSSNWRLIVITMTASAGLTSTWKTYIYNATTLYYSATNSNMNYPTGAFKNCKIGNVDCYVDDFRMYNYVLTPTQIAGIFNNTF